MAPSPRPATSDSEPQRRFDVAAEGVEAGGGVDGDDDVEAAPHLGPCAVELSGRCGAEAVHGAEPRDRSETGTRSGRWGAGRAVKGA